MGSGGWRGIRNEEKAHWRKEEGATQESGEIFGTILTRLWWDDQWNNELPTQENTHHINTALFIHCVCHRAYEKGTYSFHSWTIPFYQNETGFKQLNNCTHSKHLYIWPSYLNQWIYSWRYEQQQDGERRKHSNYLNSRAETNDGEWNVIFHILDTAVWSALDTNLDSIMTHCLAVYTGRNSPSQERRAGANQQETGRHFRPWCYLHKAHLGVFLLRGLLKSAVFSQPVLLSIIWILPSAKLEK